MQKELNKKSKLIVISKPIRKKDKVITKCECGFYKKIRYSDVLSLKSKTCGNCINMKVNKNDTFGLLTVINKEGHNNICLCKCGQLSIIGNYPLLKGKHTSCGNSIHKLGQNNPNWKGGIRDTSNNIRKSKSYKLWKKHCFERDGYMCQISGQKGGDLVIHHLEPFRLLIDDVNTEYENKLLFDINNGITITAELHIEFHKIYGVKNFTPNDFLIFKKTYAKI